MKKINLPVEISARHIHLSQKDLDKLFGESYKLKQKKLLSQTGEFAAKEAVILSKNKNMKLRIVGPVRQTSQIELSRTEAIKLKLDAPLELSGNLDKVKTFLEVQGPKGKVKVKTIVPKRHIHLSASEAKKLGLKNNQKVSVQVLGGRGLIFENVIIRIKENFNLACHLDTDEANACGLNKVCGMGKLLIK